MRASHGRLLHVLALFSGFDRSFLKRPSLSSSSDIVTVVCSLPERARCYFRGQNKTESVHIRSTRTQPKMAARRISEVESSVQLTATLRDLPLPSLQTPIGKYNYWHSWGSMADGGGNNHPWVPVMYVHQVPTLPLAVMGCVAHVCTRSSTDEAVPAAKECTLLASSGAGTKLCLKCRHSQHRSMSSSGGSPWSSLWDCLPSMKVSSATPHLDV